MALSEWLSNNWIEIFGAVTGIIYVFLEIRQNLWLWPVGIITSGVYIWVFFTARIYADGSLQGYYLVISILGWYWWVKGAGQRAQGGGQSTKLKVTGLQLRTGIVLAGVYVMLHSTTWFVLSRFTDSPVPGWDSFITVLSIIATWMLARKIYEHWYLWIVVNAVSIVLFLSRALYPTVILYIVYCIMSFAGLRVWKRSIRK